MSEKWFGVWAAFCLLVGLAFMGLFTWGIIEAIQYLHRH